MNEFNYKKICVANTNTLRQGAGAENGRERKAIYDLRLFINSFEKTIRQTMGTIN